MLKRIIALLTAGIFTLSVMAGCGQAQQSTDAGKSTDQAQATSSAAAQSSKPENVEIRFSWWGSEERHQATLKAIELFQGSNPNIKIVPEYSGYDGYQNKLTAQIAGGNAPDVFSSVAEWIPQQLSADALLDLSGLIDVSGQNKDIMAACSVDGKLYAINLAVNAQAYLYNKTQLDKYGIALPAEKYTWDDMAEKFKEIAQKSNGKLYGAVDSSVAFEIFPYFGYTYLGATEPFPYDNEKLTLTADQVKAYYKYWADLRAAKAVAPPEISYASDDSANSLAVKGTAAFVPIYTASFARFQSQTKDELGMIRLPLGKNGETGDNARPGITLSVFKKSKNQDAAVKFIDFFANSPEAAKVLKTTRGVLPTEAQRQAVMSTDGLLTADDKKVVETTDIVMKDRLKPFYPGPNGMAEVFGWKKLMEKVGQEIAFGKINIDQGAEKFISEANKIIESSK